MALSLGGGCAGRDLTRPVAAFLSTIPIMEIDNKPVVSGQPAPRNRQTPRLCLDGLSQHPGNKPVAFARQCHGTGSERQQITPELPASLRGRLLCRPGLLFPAVSSMVQATSIPIYWTYSAWAVWRLQPDRPGHSQSAKLMPFEFSHQGEPAQNSCAVSRK